MKEPIDPGHLSMLELFRLEAEHQSATLGSALLELERSQAKPRVLESLMRAAHSFKGAARIVNLQAAVRVAHALEDCFSAASENKLVLRQSAIDVLFRGVDLLAQLAKFPEPNLSRWQIEQNAEINSFLKQVEQILAAAEKSIAPSPAASPHHERTGPAPASKASDTSSVPPHSKHPDPLKQAPSTTALVRSSARSPSEDPLHALIVRQSETAERVVRLNAENLNRLLALAGESLVESRWLRPFADSFQNLRRQQAALGQKIEALRQPLGQQPLSPQAETQVNDLLSQLAACQQFLTGRLQELDIFDRRFAHLSQRLYLEVLRTRMRPFSDGTRRFPRMVRDLARALGKDVRLEVSGESTQVDRDILERLETPLAHLLRNAVDHGCESMTQRSAAGKSQECLLRLEARHSAGVLLVTVSDDGRGVDLEALRRVIVQKRMLSSAAAKKLSEPELLEFLFLPGFTLKETVTEISGRGFGLDVVQNMVKSVRGAIRITNQPGRGLRLQLQLPLTMSVLRALLVEVAGESYAIPLTQITSTLKLPRASLRSTEGRLHFTLGEQQVGLLTAHEVLECGELDPAAAELHVVVLTDRNSRYGLVVDRFLGERELVVQPLDPRLSKVREISAAALMEDGTPVLILDVEELMRCIERLVQDGALTGLRPDQVAAPPRKRILAVDDSHTVRELQRNMLTSRGYLAEVAADGLDAWNSLRSGSFDLVITDVDMPRLGGIELAELIKKDPRLKSIPVLILSYKERDEERRRGLQAGADHYLAKGSFDTEILMKAVVDLIGAPEK